MALAVGPNQRLEDPHDFGCLEPIKLWAAHAQPERPLEPGAWLCRCDTCFAALQATVSRDPRCALLVRTSFDRIVVTAECLAEIWTRDSWLDPVLFHAGDFIRDIGVATGKLPAPARWWSRCLAEQVGARDALREVVPLASERADFPVDGFRVPGQDVGVLGAPGRWHLLLHQQTPDPS
ncbi:MAG: hypothetical protein JO087_11280 [Actinobacteria bacterium]|nr:hypothetical protein [Actinomycetota bacterium]